MKENKLIQKKFDHITLLNTVQQKDMNMNPTWPKNISHKNTSYLVYLVYLI